MVCLSTIFKRHLYLTPGLCDNNRLLLTKNSNELNVLNIKIFCYILEAIKRVGSSLALAYHLFL